MAPLLRPVRVAASALALAVALTLVAAVGLGGGDQGPLADNPTSRSVAGRTQPSGTEALQARLRRLPRDHKAWAALVVASVEEARVTGDAAAYERADRALEKAATLATDDHDVLVATGTLAAARHDFRAALRAADRALDADPRSASAQLVRTDALVELGRYPAARRAAQRADRLRPGPDTFARLSYAAELRGDVDEASRLMRLARDASTADAATYAFASFHLGELARSVGRLDVAAGHYSAALEADPQHSPSLIGRARLDVAEGDLDAAIAGYRSVVRRLPLIEYVVELAELYLATGDDAAANRQLAVARTAATLAAAAGVRTDLETALFEADHGSPAAALRSARAERSARTSIHTADALGWALHAAGQNRRALPLAREATRLGTRDARLHFHHGEVAASLGLRAEARRHLRLALSIDNGVSPLRTARARDLLAELGART